jgi:tRNA G18 (ribose-2'-O)-methylase SpoU
VFDPRERDASRQGRQDEHVCRVDFVDDPQDRRLAPYRALNDAELRRRVEPATGQFIVEGVTAIRRLLVSPYRTRSVLVTEPRRRQLEPDLDGADVDVLVAPLELMRAVTGFNIHRGAVAAAERRPPLTAEAVLDGARVVAVLEGLNDHENIGAVARSAAAIGVEGLLLDPTCADPLYRRSVRVSMGAVLALPFARCPRWPHELDDARAAGFTVVALTPAADGEPIERVAADLVERRVVLLLGAEGPGLSERAQLAADHRVRIPMRRATDSLNVGHAAAIAFDRFVTR